MGGGGGGRVNSNIRGGSGKTGDSCGLTPKKGPAHTHPSEREGVWQGRVKKSLGACRGEHTQGGGREV